MAPGTLKAALLPDPTIERAGKAQQHSLITNEETEAEERNELKAALWELIPSVRLFWLP